ncbi:MAG: amidohydrolase family protein [Methanomassiliicoccales archaeon]
MIVDAHCHMYTRDMLPDSAVQAYLEPMRALEDIMDWGLDDEVVWPNFVADARELVKVMDTAGIDKSIILPLDYGRVEEPRTGFREYNRWVFESAQEFEDRIIPFVGIDPVRRGSGDFVEEHVRRWNAQGVKIYPATGFYPYEERLSGFWDAMEDLGVLVVSHTGAAWGPFEEEYCHPEYFRSVAEEHPSLRIVLAHLGGKWREEAFRLAEEFENVYSDCSALQGWLPSQPEMAEQRLREVADRIPDKVLFGTDWPIFELAYTSRKWAEFVKERSWGSGGIKEKVLHRNIGKLIDL